jgi:bifunctional UDP-N-acetylglucosamine pyrophosphorylase/glucosamine-1-phosphate N-acetyltransferase
MKAIILAGGSSKRMKSDLPKVLHKILDKPLLHHVIDACIGADITDITVVVGHQRENVKASVVAAYPNLSISFAVQEQQLGTGHAVLCAREIIYPGDNVMVLCGDVPLITSRLLAEASAFQLKENAGAVIIPAEVDNPFGYGRVMLASDGSFAGIVEQRDLKEGQESNLINSGIYVFTGEALLYGLDRIDNNNAQNEYYLTDIPAVLLRDGYRVSVFRFNDSMQLLGINDATQLAEAEAVLLARTNK